jgi:hypothetical protein
VPSFPSFSPSCSACWQPRCQCHSHCTDTKRGLLCVRSRNSPLPTALAAMRWRKRSANSLATQPHFPTLRSPNTTCVCFLRSLSSVVVTYLGLGLQTEAHCAVLAEQAFLNAGAIASSNRATNAASVGLLYVKTSIFCSLTLSTD